MLGSILGCEREEKGVLGALGSILGYKWGAKGVLGYFVALWVEGKGAP